jgi:CO/xanthine dehydrogenase Mo-binding subunit
VHDEPVFATDTVQHVGQVIGLVLASSVMAARRAARKVKLNIEELPAILKVRDALKAELEPSLDPLPPELWLPPTGGATLVLASESSLSPTRRAQTQGFQPRLR